MEQNTQPQTGNKPAAKLRFGRVHASVWANPGEKRTFYTTSFERRYRHTESGEWRSTQRFDEDDLLAIASLAEKVAWKIQELRIAASAEAELERKNGQLETGQAA